MPLQDQFDSGARSNQSRIIKRALLINRRKASSRQQRIPFSQRDRQLLGQMQRHVPAGRASPGLDKTQVPLRNSRIACQIKLTEAAPFAPVPDHLACVVLHIVHGARLGARPDHSNYL